MVEYSRNGRVHWLGCNSREGSAKKTDTLGLDHEVLHFRLNGLHVICRVLEEGHDVQAGTRPSGFCSFPRTHERHWP